MTKHQKGEEKEGKCMKYSHQQLSHFPALKYKHITSLDVSYNSISHIPESLLELKHLKDLNLKHNKISEINELMNLHGSLYSLDLSMNPVCTADHVLLAQYFRKDNSTADKNTTDKHYSSQSLCQAYLLSFLPFLHFFNGILLTSADRIAASQIFNHQTLIKELKTQNNRYKLENLELKSSNLEFEKENQNLKVALKKSENEQVEMMKGLIKYSKEIDKQKKLRKGKFFIPEISSTKENIDLRRSKSLDEISVKNRNISNNLVFKVDDELLQVLSKQKNQIQKLQQQNEILTLQLNSQPLSSNTNETLNDLINELFPNKENKVSIKDILKQIQILKKSNHHKEKNWFIYFKKLKARCEMLEREVECLNEILRGKEQRIQCLTQMLD